jgi:hypothetical protein
MSDTFYKLIPLVPNLLPPAVVRGRALHRFASFLSDADEITAEVFDHVEFVPAVENFESVACPACGTVLDEQWWWQTLDAAYSERGFADLSVTLPCCGRSASLNDLTFRGPQGFARYVLSARNPTRFDLDDWQVHELEAILGCSLRKIWMRI